MVGCIFLYAKQLQILFHDNLDAPSAYLSCDERSGSCGLRRHAVYGFHGANLLAVNGIEADFLAIVETREGDDTVVGRGYDASHLGLADIGGSAVFECGVRLQIQKQFFPMT